MKLNEHHGSLNWREKFVELRKPKGIERKLLEVSATETDAKVEG
jgi:hypothetical protein